MNGTVSHRRRLLTVHAVIFTVGVWGCCSLVARLLTTVIYPYPVGFLAYLDPFVFRSKTELLITYVLACPAMFFYFLYIKRQFHKSEQASAHALLLDHIDRPYKWVIYLVCAIAINLAWISVRPLPSAIELPSYSAYILGWFAFLLLVSHGKPTGIDDFLGRRWKLLTAVSIVEIFLAILPFVFFRPRIPNFDFRNMPETTIVRNPATGKKVALDNLNFINEHNLVGVPQYDPRIDDGHNPPHKHLPSVVIHPNKTVINFVHRTSAVLDPGDLEIFRRGGGDGRYASRSNIVYDAHAHALVAIGPVPKSDYKRLLPLLNPKDLKAVTRWYDKSQLKKLSYYQPVYTPLEWRFLVDNSTEFMEQVRGYGYFHHANFMLGCINAMALGKPLKKINSQYGFLNLVVLKHLMTWFGGISWTTYEPVLYSFFYLYIAMALIVVYGVVRDVRLLAIFALLAAGGLMMEQYKAISLAPGYNPIRHLFDLAVLWMLYCYFRKPGLKYGLALAAGLALSGFSDATTGLFLGAAVVVSLIVFRLEARRSLWGVLRLELPLAILSVMGLFLNPMHDYLAPYYLRGMDAFPLPLDLAVMAFAALIVLGVVMARWWNLITPSKKYLLLAAVLYSMGMFFYVVWQSLPNHLMTYATIYAFTAIVFLWIVTELLRRYEKRRICEGLLSLVVLAAIAFNLAGGVTYFFSWYKNNRIFETHRTYVWSNPRARIATTLPPKLFNEGAKLIDDYSHNNGIYILSRFDSILPFLADRYSKMPFPAVDWFLVTQDSVNRCVDCLKEARPRYLFVDTDIDRSFAYDMIRPGTPCLTDRVTDIIATTRVVQHTLLRKIFDKVRGEYHLVATTPLLSTWERDAPAGGGRGHSDVASRHGHTK